MMKRQVYHGGGHTAGGLITRPPPIDVELARQDALRACNPDIDRPFASFEDACHRLLAFHVLADDDCDDVKDILVDSTGRLLSSARYWNEALAFKIREQEHAFREQIEAFNSLVMKKAAGHLRAEEGVMVEQLLLQEERQRMVREKVELEARMREEASIIKEAQWTAVANRMEQSQMDKRVHMAQSQMDGMVHMANSRITAEMGSFLHHSQTSDPVLLANFIHNPSLDLLPAQQKQTYCADNILIPAHSLGHSPSLQQHHHLCSGLDFQEPQLAAASASSPLDQECIDMIWGDDDQNGSINLLVPHDNGMLDIYNPFVFRGI